MEATIHSTGTSTTSTAKGTPHVISLYRGGTWRTYLLRYRLQRRRAGGYYVKVGDETAGWVRKADRLGCWFGYAAPAMIGNVHQADQCRYMAGNGAHLPIASDDTRRDTIKQLLETLVEDGAIDAPQVQARTRQGEVLIGVADDGTKHVVADTPTGKSWAICSRRLGGLGPYRLRLQKNAQPLPISRAKRVVDCPTCADLLYSTGIEQPS